MINSVAYSVPEYEVFDPQNGKAIVTTRTHVVAMMLAIRWSMDYAKTGEGWLQDVNQNTIR